MVNHSGAGPASNAMIAGMIALSSLAVYWYMATTEEERVNQAKELKEKADSAIEQANGKRKRNCRDEGTNFFFLVNLTSKVTCLLCRNLLTLAAKDEAIKEAEKV